MPPPGGGVRTQTSPRPGTPSRSRPQNPTVAQPIGVDGGQLPKAGFQIAAHAQHHHLLIRRRAPPCTGTTGTQRQPKLIQLVSSSPTFTRHSASFFPVHFGHGAGESGSGW